MGNAPLTDKAHCNRCGGDTRHVVLYRHETRWSADDAAVSGWDTYEVLECAGCESIRFRHTTFDDADYEAEPQVIYYPPATARREPGWLGFLPLSLPVGDNTTTELLKQVYVAVHNDLLPLAAMGVRALLEYTMIAKVGDHQSFAANVQIFQKGGYVSVKQAEALNTILDAGNAAIHRGWTPSRQDVNVLLDIAESIIASVYLHGQDVKELKERIPPRK